MKYSLFALTLGLAACSTREWNVGVDRNAASGGNASSAGAPAVGDVAAGGLSTPFEGSAVAGSTASAGTIGATSRSRPSGTPFVSQGQIRAFAGGGLGDGGLGTAADLNGPSGLAQDVAGNLYIADTGHHTIRRIDGATGRIATVAGKSGVAEFSGDGADARLAGLNKPYGLAIGPDGSLLVADSGNARIRRIDLGTGIISTLAGNGTAAFAGDGDTATLASLNGPTGIAVLGDGLYIADYGNHRLRRVDLISGLITTVAGTGTAGFSGDGGLATSAQIKSPRDLGLDAQGNLYFADSGNNRIRRIDSSAIITTIAGSGTSASYSADGGAPTSVGLGGPYQPILAPSGELYVILRADSRIVKLDSATNTFVTVAGGLFGGYSGDGGLATQARLYRPVHGLFGRDGSLIFADAGNNRVRRVDSSGIISTIAGTHTGFAGENVAPDAVEFGLPSQLTGANNGALFVADTGNHRIRLVDTVTNQVSTFAGIGIPGSDGDGGLARSAGLNSPTAIAVDSLRGVAYIADAGNNRIRKVDLATSGINTYAGGGEASFSGDGGPASQAQLAAPSDVAVDSLGNLYIADTGNHRVRKVDYASQLITTIAGSGSSGYPTEGDGGSALLAALRNPSAIHLANWGELFIADTGHNSIRVVDLLTGLIGTIAGNGLAGYSGDGGSATTASLNRPHGLLVDAAGQVFFADTENHVVRKIDYYGTGTIVTVAGSGVEGYAGDGGPATAAALRSPAGVALADNRLLVVDQGNSRVRVIQ